MSFFSQKKRDKPPYQAIPVSPEKNNNVNVTSNKLESHITSRPAFLDWMVIPTPSDAEKELNKILESITSGNRHRTLEMEFNALADVITRHRRIRTGLMFHALITWLLLVMLVVAVQVKFYYFLFFAMSVSSVYSSFYSGLINLISHVKMANTSYFIQAIVMIIIWLGAFSMQLYELVICSMDSDRVDNAINTDSVCPSQLTMWGILILSLNIIVNGLIGVVISRSAMIYMNAQEKLNSDRNGRNAELLMLLVDRVVAVETAVAIRPK